MSKERERLAEARRPDSLWRKWGPYLSERQWGTVREDASSSGDAWNYVSHDMARSYAYRRGEEGLAGVCDDRQILCLPLALWNERDPILKERLYGLTNAEGNHGEDVKELYFYLDATPTHSYVHYLYKYPQRAFPYAELVAVNRRRSRLELEHELLDTGVFDDDRYFDVYVEYAKASPEDLLLEITVRNHGPAAPLHLLPTLWFRIAASSAELGDRFLCCQAGAELLFCDNETNPARAPGTTRARAGYFKDGIDERVVHGRAGAVSPERQGTPGAPT